MTTLMAVFALALATAWLLTPGVAYLARRFGLLDSPGGRKIHAEPVPRAGGIALYFAFTLPFAMAIVFDPEGIGVSLSDPSVLAVLVGGAMILTLGLYDDARGLSARKKLCCQAFVVAVAYLGDVAIKQIGVPGIGSVELGVLSFPITLFWFLLLINAMNLIDGLDGLAAGITFFATVVLFSVYLPAQNSSVALGFAALGGAALGFLRYNFNPATIFLGDAGSYFIGFNLAALSALGSVKSTTAIGLLIPVVALGVPMIDALWAAVRRFILGRKIFVADRDHIHHRLLSLGYTHRRAVLTLYAATIATGVLALSLVGARDGRAALVLYILACGTTLGIRKLGYLRFLEGASFRRWLGAVSDELGLARNRRVFFDRMLRISQAKAIDEMWAEVAAAADALGLESCELSLRVPITSLSVPTLRYQREGTHSAREWDSGREVLLWLPVTDGREELGVLVVTAPMRDVMPVPSLFRRLEQLHLGIAESLKGLRNRPLAGVAPRASAARVAPHAVP